MNTYIKQASRIPTLVTDVAEQELLSELAQEVKEKGLIVEIGALYGGMTALLALSAPDAQVITIDNFAWHPNDLPPTSAERLMQNMNDVGATNVTVIDETSQDAFLTWDRKIDLLWIDGGHSFKYVYFDLYNYGPYADVIALHDFDNPAWPDIRRAINIFLAKDKRWRFDKSAGMIAVLRRK